ncbi:MAG: hypothetical protein PHF21_01790 [Bacilli bacterium]|nr:hypothetical protein [Bacilli bacterium]
MKFLNKIFNKKEVLKEDFKEKIDVPNLMDDQVGPSLQSKEVDLMAPPVISDDEIIGMPKLKTEIVESPGIEDQLIDDVVVKKHIKNESNIVKDAFNMSPEIKEKKVEELTVNLQKTQKFCSECGTANDILNKYCISCGKEFN